MLFNIVNLIIRIWSIASCSSNIFMLFFFESPHHYWLPDKYAGEICSLGDTSTSESPAPLGLLDRCTPAEGVELKHNLSTGIPDRSTTYWIILPLTSMPLWCFFLKDCRIKAIYEDNENSTLVRSHYALCTVLFY